MTFTNVCLVLALAFAAFLSAHAGDPDILTDFTAPPGAVVDANLFTFTGLKSSLYGAPGNATFKVTKASVTELPVLAGLSVSLAVLQFAASGINPLHSHPRSSELLLVLQGTLQVGLVDSSNRLYNQTLQKGEAFVFPKGLVHFQMNADETFPAVAVSAFGSANAGTVSLPKTVFGSGIDGVVLGKSFKVDGETISELVSAAHVG